MTALDTHRPNPNDGPVERAAKLNATDLLISPSYELRREIDVTKENIQCMEGRLSILEGAKAAGLEAIETHRANNEDRHLSSIESLRQQIAVHEKSILDGNQRARDSIEEKKLACDVEIASQRRRIEGARAMLDALQGVQPSAKIDY